MKAINYLEYSINRLQYVNTDMWNDLRKATEFYSQPFTIDLIEKYFDEPEIIHYNIKYSYLEVGKCKTLEEFINYGLKEFPRLNFNKTALQELPL